jgi:prophage DNA circulation protein
MSQISDISNPWRNILLGEQASFRRIMFHVDQGSRSSGRRSVVHEYPKRNKPYAEDMGRHARRFQFSGYLIYRPSNPAYEYTSQRQLLYQALEDDDAGMLVHPVFAPGGMLAMCERFTMIESRERGGYTQFEMQFVEAGQAVQFGAVVDTIGIVGQRAIGLESSFTAVDSPLNTLVNIVRTFL